MGRELIFYPAFKDKDSGKIKPLLFTTDGKPAYIFWRSQSFIEMDWFINELPMTDKVEFDDSCKEYFANRYDEAFNDENCPTYVYLLTEDKLNSVGKSYGIVSGYVPLEDLELYYQAEYPQEYLYWQMPNPLPPEMFIEIPDDEKKKYGRLYAINTYSKEYVCSVLAETLDDIHIPWEWEGEPCILVSYSF